MTRKGRHGLAGWLLLLAGCGTPADQNGNRPGHTGAEILVLPPSSSPSATGGSATTLPDESAKAPPISNASYERPAEPTTEREASRSDVMCADGVSEDIDEAPLPCPSEMAHIGRYCIDRWEAHLITRNAEGRFKAHPHYERPVVGVRYEARSAPGMFPQGYISRVESKAACEASGKRLCTWLEWRRACQGRRWLRFPYGNSLEPGACNHLKEHLLARFFGHDPQLWKNEHFDDPRLNQEPGFLARTGAHPKCISPDGTRDQVGNLHEWVSDQVSVSFMQRIAEEGVHREKQPWRPGNGMFLGGFYSTQAEHGPGCHYTTAAHGPSYHDYSTGFRCCRDADRSATESSFRVRR